MGRAIPQPIIAVIADLIAIKETHATLDSLFAYADAPGIRLMGLSTLKLSNG